MNMALKNKLFALILTIIISFSLFSQEDKLLHKKTNYNSEIMVIIELSKPKIFLQNDEIYINVKIFNSSDDEAVCLIAHDKRFSLDFQMVTMRNRSIEHSKEYIISFHKVQPVFNSHIRLASDEGYIYKVRLNDYFDLNRTGQFFIKCLYYPDLKLNNSIKNVIYSNQLSVNIRPTGIKEEIIEEQESVEQEKRFYVTKRPPDEVVDFMLNARMKSEWEKYYLYLDLEKLILTNNNFRQKYVKADSEKQRELITKYKEYLKKNTIDEISFLPTKFEIIKTEYTEGRGKVDVLIYFKYQQYNEKKYYTYFLNKKGNIWYIYSYEVMNLGVIE